MLLFYVNENLGIDYLYGWIQVFKQSHQDSVFVVVVVVVVTISFSLYSDFWFLPIVLLFKNYLTVSCQNLN